MLDENYFVETQYLTKTAEFILTRGGYYNKTETNIIKVNLEFNSNFLKDSLKLFQIEKKDSWIKSFGKPIDLNGKWLMAGRITDEGEKRRDISKPRKTMKFLKNGNFQWIAFNTETFQFFGSGGGTYSAKNGIYTENIQFFFEIIIVLARFYHLITVLKALIGIIQVRVAKEILFMKFGQKESINYFTKIYL